MTLRVRKLDLSFALCAFAVSFGITLTAVIVVRHRDAGEPPKQPSGPVAVRVGTAGYLPPAALDRQWIAYSDNSTCADRAGGDGVSAVRLSSSQIAWFFSDSFLGPAGPKIGFSDQSGFVHNLLVVQTTRGNQSTLVTITGGNACTNRGQPRHALSVVSPADAGGKQDQRYWAGDGLRLGSRVLRFYTRYRANAIVPVGSVIASFTVRQLVREGHGPAFGAVIRPRTTKVPTYIPTGGGTPIVWGAAILRQGGTIYIYGWQSSGVGVALNCYLARVAAGRLTNVSAWQFYAGNDRWAAGEGGVQPITPAMGVSIDTGFSVIRAAGEYWLIEQAGGPGSPNIDAYPGRTPWGPFKTAAATVLYRAPGIGLTAADHYQIMYEARAEPALSTKRTLLISYNVNSEAVTAGCVPLSAYTNAVIQPRFIAVPRAEFGAAAGKARPAATANGPPAYPHVIGRQGLKWYDSWKYRGGCPPLRAVSDISVTHTKDQVHLHWPSTGPGVRYRIYLRAPGRKYILSRTADTPSVTFSDLTRGSNYQVLIVPENFRNWTGPGATIAISGL
jgi:hypothetical protein